MYQEAIEANYSHEQMTPLNSIINNSKIVQEYNLTCKIRLSDLVNEQLLPPHLSQMVKGIDNNMTFLRAIQQSGQTMHYYNLSQLMRMKIRKNQFDE